MDFFLRALTPRTVAAGALIIGIAAYGAPYASSLRQWYERRHPKPQVANAPPNSAILAELEAKERRRIELMHKRIMDLLEKSDEEGYDVSALKERAQRAAALNAPGTRFEAVRLFSELEMEIPRKKVQYIPMEQDAKPAEPSLAEEQAPQAPQQPPAPKKRRRRPRR